MPFHLLFPLFSSVVFVLGMLFGKRAISAGASPWTSTFLSNLWLALGWGWIGTWRGSIVPVEAWGEASLVGLAFVCGQMCSFLAYQFGDVSLATPVFGVKVIVVAVLLALLGDEPIELRIWAGAVLATIGIGVMQIGTRSKGQGELTWWRAVTTIVLAILSATGFSLFDVGLQIWGRRWGADGFIPVAFVTGGILSLGFLPWCDRPTRLLQLGVLRVTILGTLMVAIQAMSMSYALGHFGDATRINIVYATRGLWAVGLAWLLSRTLGTAEAHLPRHVMILRLLGASLLTAAVFIALVRVN